MKKRTKAAKTNPNDMSLLEHIEELRIRMLWIMAGLAVGLAVTYSFSEFILQLAVKPLKHALPQSSKIIFTGVTEAFWIRIEIAFVAAIIITVPWIIYQIWLFAKPGLKDSERKYALPFVFFLTLFFISGVVFAYKIVLPLGFSFLLRYGGSDLTAMPSIKQYISLLLKMLMAFGIVFEIPVVSFILSRLGIIDGKYLLKKSDYALLFIFITAAVLTPPDIFTQFLMAGPLIVLYGVSIVVAYIFSTKKDE